MAATCAALAASAQPSAAYAPTAALCVTEGRLEDAGNGELRVSVPKMRAYSRSVPADSAELRFVYLGPTEHAQALASGAMRVQFGIKLRAQDPCNLLYVMWRVQPRSELVVSFKSNAGLHTSAQCGNHGYLNLKADSTAALPQLAANSRHELSALLREDTIEVRADDRLVWRGPLSAAAAALRGPVGVRTDNARLEFALGAGAQSASPPLKAMDCRSEQGESD